MMSLWDALRMNMMISYQELVRTFPKTASHSNNDKHGNRQDRYGLNAYFLPPRQGDMFTQSRQKSGLGQLCRRGG
ncbi:hypothetical protein CEG93_04485 [Raoultella ornithinolytica]|nr:hypothetical protein CEG93_04485 [Raoultella ornithinolytica]